MSTWRRRFSRKSPRLNENDEILMNNTMKYRKKLQAATSQINRTKKAAERNFDSSDSQIHVARLINDIGQLSDCRPLQEISGLVDSLAMRQQLSSRIFNEYAMNSLQQACENLNHNLSKDFDQRKSVVEEAKTNHCCGHTKKHLTTKVENEWCQHQKLAVQGFKRGLSSYCEIGLCNLKLQIAILEKLQKFVDQLPQNDDINSGLPNFSANSLQTRREIDTMLRSMLDSAPNDSASLPEAKKPKFLNNHLTLSNSLYSPETTEAIGRSHRLSLTDQRNSPAIAQYASMIPVVATTQHESTIIAAYHQRFNIDANLSDGDHLPSYTDLFVVPSSCKDDRIHVV